MSVLRIMNRTTTVVVALIAAAGLSTMVYSVPEQRALAWAGGFGGCGFGFGGCGGGFFDPGCGFGCGGGFFGDGFHKHIVQTIHQVNNCTGNGEDQQPYNKDNQDQNQKGNCCGEDQQPYNKDKKTVCINTAVNTAGRGFGGLGSGLGSDGLNH
jgi:hypothetical protein